MKKISILFISILSLSTLLAQESYEDVLGKQQIDNLYEQVKSNSIEAVEPDAKIGRLIKNTIYDLEVNKDLEASDYDAELKIAMEQLLEATKVYREVYQKREKIDELPGSGLPSARKIKNNEFAAALASLRAKCGFIGCNPNDCCARCKPCDDDGND